ncbi:hypothetical protein [Paraburkholderia phenazinium]|uniref:hypothetical protein n=1 Tax=Paraburkholderia phenazinium TaxID=60549 RepID=UPI00117F9FC9|nr:hypothetical protein [Paraburkholderia phenazinium]
MSQSFKLSRRAFFKVSLVAGISVCIAPWSQEALAELFEERLLTPVRWDPRTSKTAFRALSGYRVGHVRWRDEEIKIPLSRSPFSN